MHDAAALGFAHIAEVLLDPGADPVARTVVDDTALHLGAAKGDGALVDLLVREKVDLQAIDCLQLTALHCAAS